MASRDTLQEAEECAAELRARYPDADIRISARDITIGWPPKPATVYDIVEVRRCARCSAEVETEAFGETYTVLCSVHKAERQAELEAEHKRRAAESRRAAEFADRYMRDGGRGWGLD